MATPRNHGDTEQSFAAFTNDKRDVAAHLQFREVMVSKPNKMHLIPGVAGMGLNRFVCTAGRTGENQVAPNSFWVSGLFKNLRGFQISRWLSDGLRPSLQKSPQTDNILHTLLGDPLLP